MPGMRLLQRKCSSAKSGGLHFPVIRILEYLDGPCGWKLVTCTCYLSTDHIYSFMIYHVTTQGNWDVAMAQGYYSADSIALEGFIHCSKKDQVAGVLSRYYQGEKNLLLLSIDPSKVSAPLKYELAPSVKEEFPHIYGTLNLDAVVHIEKIN